MTCWQTLGIAPTSDEAAIKQAYAARIREHRPDRDPEGFRAVRAAYEEALRLRAYIRPHHEKKMQRRRAAEAAPDAASEAMTDQSSPAAAETPHIPPDTAYYGYIAALPPEITEALREPENVAYLERPAPHERETAPHDYRDRPADSRENPAALLARLQGEWQDASDDKLLAILQAQADEAALQHIDLRSDYLDALRDDLIAHAPLPQSTIWAGEQYQLHRDHDGEYRRIYLAALVALRQRPAFVAALAPHYPELAAWLKRSAWQRFCARWQDWRVESEHPAHRQWHALLASLQSALLPYHHQQAWRRHLRLFIMSALLLTAVIAIFTTPNPIPGIFWTIGLLTNRDWWVPSLDPVHNGKRLLFRACPPLRGLDQAYRRFPYWLRWLLADIAVITLSIDNDATTPVTILWLIIRAFYLLWQYKRVIAAQTPPAFVPSRSLLLFIALVWLAFTFLTYLTSDPSLAATACGSAILLYLLCWWRVPADDTAARRAFLDQGALTIPAAFMFVNGDAPTLWPLIICPLLALVLGYRYRFYPMPRLLRPLEPLGQTLARFALLAIHLPNAIGIGVFALRIYQDSGVWPMTAFILLCLLHIIATIQYHLKHPA
ncbi:J domain-containing protein [Cardiobacterium hominis]|uniref:J domain-containing protein n=1 Tax=Cardiobacterium hominis TaxID=2718 RepID=UPI0028E8C4DC|nr:J domain-containing protein [Cardiobacterium hominis]